MTTKEKKSITQALLQDAPKYLNYSWYDKNKRFLVYLHKDNKEVLLNWLADRWGSRRNSREGIIKELNKRNLGWKRLENDEEFKEAFDNRNEDASKAPAKRIKGQVGEIITWLAANYDLGTDKMTGKLVMRKFGEKWEDLDEGMIWYKLTEDEVNTPSMVELKTLLQSLCKEGEKGSNNKFTANIKGYCESLPENENFYNKVWTKVYPYSCCNLGGCKEAYDMVVYTIANIIKKIFDAEYYNQSVLYLVDTKGGAGKTLLAQELLSEINKIACDEITATYNDINTFKDNGRLTEVLTKYIVFFDDIPTRDILKAANMINSTNTSKKVIARRLYKASSTIQVIVAFIIATNSQVLFNEENPSSRRANVVTLTRPKDVPNPTEAEALLVQENIGLLIRDAYLKSLEITNSMFYTKSNEEHNLKKYNQVSLIAMFIDEKFTAVSAAEQLEAENSKLKEFIKKDDSICGVSLLAPTGYKIGDIYYLSFNDIQQIISESLKGWNKDCRILSDILNAAGFNKIIYTDKNRNEKTLWIVRINGVTLPQQPEPEEPEYLLIDNEIPF